MAAAGKFDRRIQFQRYTLADDGFQQVQTWVDHGSKVSARMQDVSDGERYRAEDVSATITTRFQVRYSDFTRDITPKDRLVFERRIYEIVGIKELAGRRKVLELTTVAQSDVELLPYRMFSDEFAAEFA